MNDCLITRIEAARVLGISPRCFDGRKAALIGILGLKEVAVGRSRRYLKSSVEWIKNELLDKRQAALFFGQSKRSFERFKSYYISNHGLKEIAIGRGRHYTRSSIRRIINNVTTNETDLGV